MSQNKNNIARYLFLKVEVHFPTNDVNKNILGIKKNYFQYLHIILYFVYNAHLDKINKSNKQSID